MTRFASSALATLTAASGLFALTAGSALADTNVFQARSICVGGTAGATVGTMTNPSFTTFVNVYCSINRDRTDAKPTLVQVTVVDNSSLLIGDGNFSCNLTPVSRTGALVGTPGGSAVTTGVNSAGQILTVPIPAAVPTDGTMTLKCKVPRRGAGDPVSLVASIKVVEPDPTN